MGSALRLLIGGPAALYVIGFAAVSVGLEVFVRYSRYVSVLKYLTLALLAYVGAVFVVGVPWGTVAWSILIPPFSFDKNYVLLVVAVLGTTISPYLFFWQAEEEVEEERENPRKAALVDAPAQAPSEFFRIRIDTYVGMALSNAVAPFIVQTTAVTLNAHGITDIQSSTQAAEALRPIAGQFHHLRHGNHRDRAARDSRSCRISCLRTRRSTQLVSRTGEASQGCQAILRHRRARHPCRPGDELRRHRSHQGALRQRGHQRPLSLSR